MRKDDLLPLILIIRQRETLLKPNFAVGADEVGETCNDQLANLDIPIVRTREPLIKLV
jgi:hypothetical protein